MAQQSQATTNKVAYKIALMDVKEYQTFPTETDSVTTIEDSDEEKLPDEEEWTPPQKPTATTRPIPIPKAAPNKSKMRSLQAENGNVDEYESTEYAERMYDLATWSMYERIVEYRQRTQPFGLVYNSHDSALPQSTRDHEEQSHCTATGRRNPEVDYYEMDDCIFDMEV